MSCNCLCDCGRCMGPTTYCCDHQPPVSGAGWEAIKTGIRDLLTAEGVTVPTDGTYLVIDGVAHRVVEHERVGRIENAVGYSVWVEQDE